MEHLGNTMLMHLEEQSFSPERTTFGHDTLTEDRITDVSKPIEDVFQQKQHILAVWLNDIAKPLQHFLKDLCT